VIFFKNLDEHEKMYILSLKIIRKKGYMQNWTIAFCIKESYFHFSKQHAKENGVINSLKINFIVYT
jgi:hypothetical protein